MFTENKLPATEIARNARRAKLAGTMVDWRATKIQATDGAKQSDPFQELRETYGRGMGLSYGRDAAAMMDATLDLIEEVSYQHRNDNDTARSALCGLRYYLGMLPRGEKPKSRVVRPLIERFMMYRNQ